MFGVLKKFKLLKMLILKTIYSEASISKSW